MNTPAAASCTASAGPGAAPREALSGRDAALFGLGTFCVYLLTGSRWLFGYEGSNLDQARALLWGTARHDAGGVLLPYTQGGLLEVAAYFPGIWLQGLPLPGGLRDLAMVWIMPAQGALLALAALWLAWEIFPRRSRALGAAAVFAFATMAWPYSKWGMEVAQAGLTAAGMAAVARLGRLEGRSAAAWVALGAAAGLLGLTKVTGIVHGAVLMAAGLLAGLGAGGRGQSADGGDGAQSGSGGEFDRRVVWKWAAIGLALFSAGLAATLLANLWRYNGWIVGGRYSASHAGSVWNIPGGLAGLLFSPNKSLFLFNPPLLAGLAVLAWLAARRREMAVLAGVAAALSAMHLMTDPWTDETYGPRRFLWLVALGGVCAAGAWDWWGRWGKGLLAALIVAGVAAQVLAGAFNFTNLPFVAGRSGDYHAQAMVWNPAFQPQRFHAHLTRSFLGRALWGREARPFEVRREYFAWLENGRERIAAREERLRAAGATAEEIGRRRIEGNGAVEREAMSVKGYDVPDYWAVQRAPGEWGLGLLRSLMALALAGGAVVCAVGLVGPARLGNPVR